MKKKLVQVIKRINPDIIKGLTACLNQDGLHVWLEMTSDPKIFRLALRYKLPGEPFFVKIKNLTITNARCDQSLLTISKDGDKAANLKPVLHRDRCILPHDGWEMITNSLSISDRGLQMIQGIFDDRKEYAIAQELKISVHTVHKLGVSTA